jgi:acetoacetyl-CoA synthetase
MSPPVLWTPTPEQVEASRIVAFARAAGQPTDYAALHRWSVDDLDAFWTEVWRQFGVAGEPGPAFGAVRDMPTPDWFPEARVNYAKHLLADVPRDPDAVAIHHASELADVATWTWRELREETARVRAGLVARGVGEGDRVAAYLPNVPATIAAMLATASLGAIWTVAAPEFGAQAVIDRFAQLEPSVLLAVDGYRYGGRDFDRTGEAARIAEAIGAPLVRFGHLDGSGWEPGFVPDAVPPLAFAEVGFRHPLWVLYSSGTTGLPKAIVHGHGGILLEQIKHSLLHLDVRTDDRVFWFSTTGWMMWNFLVGVLLSDAPVVLYDGSPAGEALWDLADRAGVTVFGTSAAYITAQLKDGAHPRTGRDLRIRAVGSTGSPLPPEGFDWVRDELGDVWLFSTSGGTDVCTAFVGGVPVLPVHQGELQGAALGCAVEAWDDDGHAVVGEVGELVIAKPMPSMPIELWGDADGSRLRETYYDHYPVDPPVWRHGDWISFDADGAAVIHGRSDATINRGGIRMGTSEIYRAILAVDEIADALVVDVPRPGAENWMPLLVVLRPGVELDDDLVARVRKEVRTQCSPRHIPDTLHVVDAIPRTLSGKALEVPVKRILMGADPDAVVNRGALANPEALDAVLAIRDAAPVA